MKKKLVHRVYNLWSRGGLAGGGLGVVQIRVCGDTVGVGGGGEGYTVLHGLL